MGNGQGSLSAEEQKAISDATQLAGMYLRSSSHILSKHPYLPIGKRPNEKQYFLVNHSQTKEDRLMVMVVRSEESPLALHVEANKALFTGFLEGLKHPYVLPMLEVDYLSDRQQAVLFKPFSHKAGSLRDSIVKCKNPKDPFDQKYQKAGNQISIRLIRLYGRQILEGLYFLRRRHVPFPHLHSGNIILDKDKKVCRLSEIESAMLGLQPRYNLLLRESPAAGQVDPEVLCFGQVLYEMSIGWELQTAGILDCLPSHCYREVVDILYGIFSPSEGNALCSVKDLLVLPFFADIEIKEDVKDCSSSPSDLEKEMLKRVKRGQAVEIAKKVKKEKKHSDRRIGVTSEAVASAYDGASIAQPKERKHKKDRRRSASREPEPAAAEQPAMAALPAPAAAPAPAQNTTAVEDVRELARAQAAQPAPAPAPVAEPAPAPAGGKGGKGGKGKKGPPAMGKGKGDGGDALAKLRAEQAAKPKPAAKPPPAKGAGANMSSGAAAGATMDAIASLGSPGAVLALLKKAKNRKPVGRPKPKELTFKEKLALQFAR